jgi:hypothetical protein
MTTKTSDRKFDTWEWSDRTVAPEDLAFEVRLERPVNVAEGPLRYYIAYDNPPIRVEAHDLALLRELLDTAVRAFYAVEWVPVLVVRFDPTNSPDKLGGAVDIKIEEYEQGKLHGRSVYRARRTRGEGKSYDYRMTEGDIERTFKRSYNSEPLPRYVLLDTPQNRDLLACVDAELQTWVARATGMVKAKAIP